MTAEPDPTHHTRNARLLEQLFEQSPSFMAMLVGPEHRIALANHPYMTLVGHRPVIGRTVREALPDAVAQGYLDILDTVFRTGRAHAASNALYSVQATSGGEVTDHYVDFVYQPMRNAAGQVTGIFVHGFDVTQRRRLEDRLAFVSRLTELLGVLRDPAETAAAAAAMLGTALNASRVGYGTIDHRTDTLHVQKDWTAPGVASLAGATPLRAYGSFIDDLKQGSFISIDDVRLDARTSFACAALEGKHARSFVNHPVLEHGTLVAVLFVNCAEPRRWRKEELDLIREVGARTRTAVERASAESFLKDSGEQLRLATEAAEVGLWDVDLVSDTLYWPARVKAMFGISAGVHVTMDDFYQGLHPEDFEATAAAFASAADPQQRAQYDVEYRTVGKEDGVVRWVAAKGRGIFDDAGRCVRVIGTAIDITARKAGEAALLHSEEQLRESSRRKDQFIATLAHELRNPLAPLSNAILLLEPAPAQAPLRDTMRRQVDHLVRLVDDLLEVSRISGGVFELRLAPVTLASVVQDAVEASELLVRERGHSLHIALPPEPVWVRADAVRLAQIVTNLLHNAARYTAPGGRITVQAGCGPADCRITVTDTGQGFDAEQGSRMFEMFHRGKTSTGLGIGLALSSKLAEMHQGRIEATSAGPGQGARFTLHLPRAEAPPSRLGAPSATPAALRPAHVLVVDDNADAADILALLLTQMGLDVEVAYDGAQALKAFAQFRPAVVFLDIGMPGMDGYEVARRMRRDFPGQAATLVGLSGWGQPEDIARGRDAGFDRHLMKPADMNALTALLASLPAAPGIT